VDFKQATNNSGIFAAGECEYQYHGRTGWARTRWCRAFMAEASPGPNAVSMRRGLQAMSDGMEFSKPKEKAGSEQFPAHEQRGGRRIRSGLWQELGGDDEGLPRYPATTRICADGREAGGVAERLSTKVISGERTQWANYQRVFTRQLYNMLQLARGDKRRARACATNRAGRITSRIFPERDDKEFL